MSCKINNGPHTFFHTPINNRLDPPKLGARQEFEISTWHTCIACGERRAITIWGELLVKENDEWIIKNADNSLQQ